MVKKIRAYGSNIGSVKTRIASTGLTNLNGTYLEGLVILKTGSNALVTIKDGAETILRFMPTGDLIPNKVDIETDISDNISVDINYLDPSMFVAFDEASGDVAEEKITAEDGKLKNMENSSWKKDRPRGRHIEFDGVDEYVDFGHDICDYEYDHAFTFSFWMKAPPTPWACIFDKTEWWAAPDRDGYHLNIRGNELRWSMYGSTSAFIEKYFHQDVCDNEWHHIAISYDGSHLAAGCKLYIDGTEITNVSVSKDSLGTSTIRSTSEFVIGTWKYIDEFYEGKIDKFLGFDRALSDNEIDFLRRNGVTMAHTDGLESCEVLIMYS